MQYDNREQFRAELNRIFANNSESASDRTAEMAGILERYTGHIEEAELDDMASFVIFGKKDLSMSRRYEVDKEAKQWAQ